MFSLALDPLPGNQMASASAMRKAGRHAQPSLGCVCALEREKGSKLRPSAHHAEGLATLSTYGWDYGAPPLIIAMTAPWGTVAPAAKLSALTVPSIGLAIWFSIFIVSKTTTTSPALT